MKDKKALVKGLIYGTIFLTVGITGVVAYNYFNNKRKKKKEDEEAKKEGEDKNAQSIVDETTVDEKSTIKDNDICGGKKAISVIVPNVSESDVVKAGYVNVRQKAKDDAKDSPVVFKLKAGYYLPKIGSTENYWKVQYPITVNGFKTKAEGYIHKRVGKLKTKCI